jgi:predicted peptidase
MRHSVRVLAAVVACLAWSGRGGAQDVKQLLEKREYRDAGGKVLPYRLLKPDDFDPKQEYPLVLFLHGAGERGTDNERQLIHGIADLAKPEVRSRYPCFLVVPQCPPKQSWSDVNFRAKVHKQPEKPSEPMRLTLELLEELRKEFPIDPRCLYITGLSMGGYGTWDVIARRPELFAAAVPVCGGGDESLADVIAKIPVWAFHGARDNVVPPERSWNMIAALKKAGGRPGYTEYPDVGHDSWGPAYRDPQLVRWLFAQKRP